MTSGDTMGMNENKNNDETVFARPPACAPGTDACRLKRSAAGWDQAGAGAVRQAVIGPEIVGVADMGGLKTMVRRASKERVGVQPLAHVSALHVFMFGLN